MLRNILAAFAEYKTLSIAFFVALILMIFAWIMAARSIGRRNRERDAVLGKLKEEATLRKEFSNITAESALAADGKRLMHGISLNVQQTLDKAPDLMDEFDALPDPVKCVYALSFVFCEDADTLSAFFRLNGKPLTEYALMGAEEIFDEDTLAIFSQCYKMFDDDDEETSCLPEDVEKLDRLFALADKTVIFNNTRTFVSQNIEAFRL